MDAGAATVLAALIASAASIAVAIITTRANRAPAEPQKNRAEVAAVEHHSPSPSPQSDQSTGNHASTGQIRFKSLVAKNAVVLVLSVLCCILAIPAAITTIGFLGESLFPNRTLSVHYDVLKTFAIVALVTGVPAIFLGWRARIAARGRVPPPHSN